ncbi:MAG: hypothetical protein ABH864_06200 [archaeon]
MAKLAKTVQRHKGGWSTAVETAGIDYEQFRKRVKRGSWNRERVIEEIKRLQSEGISLNAGYISDKQSGLHHAAGRHIGKWGAALAAAGIDPNSVRLTGPPIENGELLARIQQLSEQGQDLSTAAMAEHDSPEIRRVYQTAARRYGSWRSAITEAGLPYDQIRRVRGQYSRRELITAIKGFEEQGIVLTPQEIKAQPNGPRIYHAISRRFDS